MVRRLLDAYVSNELLVETNSEILEHLEHCSDCSAALDSRLRARAALKHAVTQEIAPPELMESIRMALPQRSLVHRQWAAAAVLLALLLGSAGFWYLRRGQELRAEGSERILNMGLNAVEHCPESARLDDLGWEYNGLAEVLGEEMPSDYGIAGAHRCMLDGRLFVRVVLEAGDSRVYFVVTENREDRFSADPGERALSAEGVPVYTATIRNHQVAGFETRRHLAFLVSPNLTRDANLQLATSIAALHAPLMRSTLEETRNAH
jgi:hypothetical protein